MARDPRDTLVSHYHHCRNRERSYKGTLPAFVRHRHYGIHAIIEFLNGWAAHRAAPASFRLCRYEDLRGDTEPVLREVLAFLGETTPDETALTGALDDGSIDTMRQREQSGDSALSGMERSAGTPDAGKIRKGRVGGYRDTLSEADTNFVDRAVAETLDPFFGYS